MKHTVRLGKNQYINLDSYGESNKTRRINNLMVAFLAVLISVVTVPAMLGIDITSPNTTTQHEYPHRTRH
jgi:hypothetical protein